VGNFQNQKRSPPEPKNQTSSHSGLHITGVFRRREGNMFVVENNSKNSLARRSLYCVWVRKDDHPGAQLVAIWIDPAMRAFESQVSEQTQDQKVQECFFETRIGP
jgi:hypothetical protein